MHSRALGEGRLGQGQDSYLQWRRQSYRGRALQGRRDCRSRDWPGGHHPGVPGQKGFPDLREKKLELREAQETSKDRHDAPGTTEMMDLFSSLERISLALWRRCRWDKTS